MNKKRNVFDSNKDKSSLEFYIVPNMKPKRSNNVNHLLALCFDRSHDLINHMMWRFLLDMKNYFH